MHESKWLHSEIPQTHTVLDFIKTRCPWDEAVQDIGQRFEPHLSFDPKINSEAACAEVYELYRDVGAVAWRSQPGLSLYGLSLSYNPAHARDCWHIGSFGHPRYRSYSRYEYFRAVERDLQNRVKDDYLDSLGFRALLPELSDKPALSGYLNRFRAPVVRSTVRTINGCLTYPSIAGDGGMHQDDSPFEVLRVNLCLTESDLFGIQYLGHPARIFQRGKALVVNTDTPHRAYIAGISTIQRTNLIVGVTPWLDFQPEQGLWRLNDHFGRAHPYDLVRSGELFNGNF